MLSVILCVGVALGRDFTPLQESQRVALMQVWKGFNCLDEAYCPTIAVGAPCPNTLRVPPHYESLVCDDGLVRQIALDVSGLADGGTIPSAIGLLTGLTTLFVFSQYGLASGTIPTEIGLLTQLRQLNLCCNSAGLSGTLPSQLGKLTRLVEFGVHFSSFGGTIPSQLASIDSLGFVRFYQSQFVGVVPRFLGINFSAPDAAISCQASVDNDSNCFSDCSASSLCCKSTRMCPYSTIATATTQTRTTPPAVQTTATDSLTILTTDSLTTVKTDSLSSSQSSSSLEMTQDEPLTLPPGFTPSASYAMSGSINQTLLSDTSTMNGVIDSSSVSSSAPPSWVWIVVGVVCGMLVLAASVTAVACLLSSSNRRRNQSQAFESNSISTPFPADAATTSSQRQLYHSFGHQVVPSETVYEVGDVTQMKE
jgi:hypothetical protein